MSLRITKTKIIPPAQRPDMVTRTRLLEIFDELLVYRLILLVAPAGYGKTSVLVDLAHNGRLPVCWYSVDILDQDPHRFFAYFVAALRQRFPDFGAESTAILQTMETQRTSLEQLVSTIVNEVYESIEGDFVVVVDDYHLVDGSDRIGEFVSRFIQNIGDKCHLVFASRKLLTVPDLPLMVARSQVGGLDYEDLAFLPEEVQLLPSRRDTPLSRREAEDLIDQTEGWITGLMLSTRSHSVGALGHGRLTRASGVSLYDYLADQVLEQQTPALRSFLLHSSVLEEFDAELCEEILGPERLPAGQTWYDLIDAVLASGLFALPVGEEGAWIRYHRLFQEFLLYRLHREAPEEEKSIQYRLAKVCAEQQNWERAYHLYQKLQDEEAVVDLVEQAGVDLLRSGRLHLLDSWTAALTAALLNQRPRLLSLRGVVLIQLGNVSEGKGLLTTAIDLQQESDDQSGLAQTLARRSVVLRLEGDRLGSSEDSLKAIEILDDIAQENVIELESRALALKNLGMNEQALGNMDSAVARLQASLEVYKSLDEPQHVAALYSDIGIAYQEMGQFQHALDLMEQAASTWRTMLNTFSLAIVLNNMGYLYHQLGDYTQALSMLGEALECAEKAGYKRFAMITNASLGDLFIDLGMWDAAVNTTGQALGMAKDLTDRFMSLYVTLSRVRLACARQDWEQAYEYLNSAATFVGSEKLHYEWGLYRMTMGQFFLTRDEPIKAVEALEQASWRWQQGHRPIETAVALFYQAVAYDGCLDRRRALAILDNALDMAFSAENAHPVVAAAHGAQEFLRSIKPSELNSPHLKTLLQRINEFERTLQETRRGIHHFLPPQLVLLFNVQPMLKIHALGRTQVFLNGEVVTNKAWKTAATRELLFCLLLAPAGLTRPQIIEYLWPGCSVERANKRFKNTVYRLRSAIGQETVCFEDSVYRFDRSVDYRYDVEIFLRKLADAARAESEEERLTALEEALEAYGGDYLLDLDTDWSIVERERLRMLYMDGLNQAALISFRDGDFTRALEKCAAMLEVDRCNEDAHRLAMEIHAAAGNRAAVVRQFHECRQALKFEIEAPPSDQTEKLYARLMA